MSETSLSESGMGSNNRLTAALSSAAATPLKIRMFRRLVMLGRRDGGERRRLRQIVLDRDRIDLRGHFGRQDPSDAVAADHAGPSVVVRHFSAARYASPPTNHLTAHDRNPICFFDFKRRSQIKPDLLRGFCRRTDAFMKSAVIVLG